jgi:hypothetical protein
MMTMVKLDVAELERAFNDASPCSSSQMPELSMNAAQQAAAADRHRRRLSGRR